MKGHTPGLLPGAPIVERPVCICCCTRLGAAVAQEATRPTWGGLNKNVPAAVSDAPGHLVLGHLMCNGPAHNYWHASVMAAWPVFLQTEAACPALSQETIKLTATQRPFSA